MDCFFAAVEVKHNPSLKGKAIAVGGSPEERGVISTASYEARKFGVRSALASSRALKLCPHLVLIPPHFDLYHEESEAIREIFFGYTSKVEPLSLDEAFLDVTNCERYNGSATLIAKEIRQKIFEKTGLTCSAGVAPNKFLAKIASDWNKPNGIKIIRPDEVSEFVRSLSIEKIFGVGKVTAQRMHELGYQTCEDLQKQSLQKLHQEFGNMADYFYEICRGQDDREVETEWIRKSLSVEWTYPKDLRDLNSCLEKIPELFEEFQKRWQLEQEEALEIRGLYVKIKFFDFKQTTLERSNLIVPTLENYQQMITEAFKRRDCPVRLLGIGVRLREKKEEADDRQLRFPNLY